MQGATTRHSLNYAEEEQRSRRSKMGFPEGLDDFFRHKASADPPVF
jgi:hypothetical protein